MNRKLLLMFLPTILALSACSDSSSGGGKPTPGAARVVTVGVMAMKSAAEPLTVVLPGRAAAYRSVDIRPQVGGTISLIAYKEGSQVKKGDLLFKIEDGTYQAAVAEAEAALARAQASVPSAEANVARYERLVNSGATQIELDTAKVTLLQANADVASAKASLQSAKINLDHTSIFAPFDGIADVSNFSEGNLVTANQTDALTTVKQVDPIYVELSDSSVNLLKFRAALQSGSLKSDGIDAPIHLTLENGAAYDETGTFDVPKSTISETTGSFIIRASFPNPQRLIVPGMYVSATLTVGSQKGFLIPQRAASRNSEGNLTAQFVGKDGKVETRVFSSASASNNSWLVTTGVEDGDLVIVDGLQSISDGMEVKTTPVTLDADGVAHDAAAQSSATAVQKTGN
jgi:membrane fusion protein, multidrug efflux system